MTLLLQDTLVISPKTKQQVDKNTAAIAELQEKAAIAYHFKGSKPTFNDLPTTGNEVGDVWDVKDTGVNYGWTGTEWDELGPLADLEPYLTKEEAASTYLTQTDATETYPTKIEVEEALKTAGSGYDALSAEQRDVLLDTGLYNGKEVNDAEVFTQYDGKFVEVDKTLNPGGDWGTSSLTGQEYVETRGLYGNGITCIPAGIYNSVNVSSDRGRTWKYYSNRTIASYNGTLGGTNYCFNGQQFVGLNGGWLYTSTDGVNWSSKQTNAGSTTAGLAFGNGKYITISNGIIKYSEDGLNWFAIQDSTSFSNYSLQAFANGKFIAVGQSSVAVSEDGENWSIHSKPSGNGRQCAGGNGIFVISDVENWSYGSRNTFFYSTDGGITWNTSYTASSRSWVGLSWCGDRFFAVSHKDNLYTYSFDGINWTEGTMPQWDYWTTVTYADGDIIVTCGHGVNKPSVAYVSFQPFYEYALTDLSYSKAEVDALLNQAYVTTSWTIPLPVADWVENQQTFTIQGLTADSSVDLNPVVPTTREEMIKLSNAGLFISALGENSVTIECMNLPTEDLVVKLKREMTTNLVLDGINTQLAEINGV